MKYFIFILSFFLLQEVPFKPKEEFEIKLDYQFRQRPLGDPNTVLLENPRRFNPRSNTGVLPYLILHINLLSLPEEKMRMQITTNLKERPTFKKVSVNSLIELDLGFTDDMKDRVNAHEYKLTFITADKKPVDHILITVDQDGTFSVNGEIRGKL